eukprot:5715550-Alexandrium_andersonii.AAC.1
MVSRKKELEVRARPNRTCGSSGPLTREIQQGLCHLINVVGGPRRPHRPGNVGVSVGSCVRH